MLKTTLKTPKTDKITLSIIGVCKSPKEIAEAIDAFWGEGAPGADENFILKKFATLLQQESPGEQDINAFTKMTTALMGKTLKSAKETMFAGHAVMFIQFARPAADALGISSLYLSDPKVWKFCFVSGDVFRLRGALKSWNESTTAEQKDAAALTLRSIISPLQESDGRLKGGAFQILYHRFLDLLGGQIGNIFAMLNLSTEKPFPTTIQQDEADKFFRDVKAAGASVLTSLSQPADAMISAAKDLADSMLDQQNKDSLEWLNIRTFFGAEADKVKQALINGRLGFGNPARKDGCQNFINSGPSGGASWLKDFMQHPISKVEPVIEELRGKMLNASAIDDSQADQWVAGIKVSKPLVTEYDLRAGKDGQFTRDLKDVFRLAGGRIRTLTTIDLNRGRSFASMSTKSISLNPRGGKAVLWHEVGHHFEYSNPDYLKLALAFLTERAGGNRQAIAPLNRFYTNNYADSEVAIVDNFSSPYVGKIYGPNSSKDVHSSVATEVFSSGFEYLAINSRGATSLLNGDELIEFVTGILKGVHE
ncbi:hypothetical protein [Pantoea sp. CCBC3-3-1]|uniref:hypothetical protein n=1 Tax=Pantoea sp. CCBC3-3-1 TaxID=2490851 RepID=UPI0011BDCAEC|nr:hypothetical protein [Pantoea sp. CCBC3-3-1]